jgi:hypothetical protein
MLEYRLDDLHWTDFEQLCQALLKARLGIGVEAWGGSGDWGNDAYCQASLCYPGSEVQEGPFQFQAKFVQGANAAGANQGRRWLRQSNGNANGLKSGTSQRRRSIPVDDPPPSLHGHYTRFITTKKQPLRGHSVNWPGV